MELQKEVRLTSRRNAFVKEARQNIQNGANSHFHLQNGLLWYKKKRFYVPEGKMRCRNPTLAKCGGEAQHLEKLEVWSPPGLPNV
jgi:hypothetical protein